MPFNGALLVRQSACLGNNRGYLVGNPLNPNPFQGTLRPGKRGGALEPGRVFDPRARVALLPLRLRFQGLVGGVLWVCYIV